SKSLTGMSLFVLLNHYSTSTAAMGYGDANDILIEQGINVATQPIQQDLINQITSFAVGNLDYITGDMQDRLAESLQEGYASGEGIPDLADRVQDVLDISDNKATRDARTLTNEIYNQAHLARYQDSNVVTGVQYVCAQSEGTCDVCAALGGTIWDINDPNIVTPPTHYNCRCRLLSYL